MKIKEKNTNFETKLENMLETALQGFLKGLRLEYILESIFTMFFTAIWLLLVNTFWKEISFLTYDFDQIVTLINIAGVITIVLYSVLLLLRFRIVHYFVEVANNIVSIFVTYKIYSVFPFEFGGDFDFLNDAGKPILIILMILIVLGIITKTFEMFKPEKKAC